MAKIKRSDILTYIDIVPDTEDYELLGVNVVTGTINLNPKTTEETFIHEDNATISVESYAPTMPIEMSMDDTDVVALYLEGLMRSRAVLGDCETTIVNVWNYLAGGPTACVAEQQSVSIQVDSVGGEGGQAAKLNVTINYQGDPTIGTFNTSTKVFT